MADFLSFGGHNKLVEVPKGNNHQAPTEFGWSQRVPNCPISNQIIQPMNVLAELYTRATTHHTSLASSLALDPH
jgi:hypothetical protein